MGAPPANTPKMQRLGPAVLGHFVGLLAQGVAIQASAEQTVQEFGKAQADFPQRIRLYEWVRSEEGQRLVSEAREALREEATSRSFADIRQQVDALVSAAERLYTIFVQTKDEEILTLIRLSGEVRETFKAIREATSPFQTQMPEVLSSFEQFQKKWAEHLATRPKSIQEELGN